MGVDISDILSKQQIDISFLKGQIIAIDAHIFLYQFLTTIRQRDGTPLMDSKGNVTSHLSGIFSRTAKLLEQQIRPVYVFDGKPNPLKLKERERRRSIKEDAKEKYEHALGEENIDDMRKYAQRQSRLTPQIIAESKELLRCLGVPVVEAPSEGEAQAAYMVKQQDAYAVASQDADSLLFGTPLLLRNLSVAGKRKRTNKLAYEEIRPEIINLSKTLGELTLTQDELIVLGILVGTDFDNGIKGIGPKSALKLLKEHHTDFDSLFDVVKWDSHFNFSWKEVFEIFKNPPIKKDYNLIWHDPDKEKVMELLVEKHEFSEDRVTGTLDKIFSAKEKNIQKGLGEFFKF